MPALRKNQRRPRLQPIDTGRYGNVGQCKRFGNGPEIERHLHYRLHEKSRASFLRTFQQRFSASCAVFTSLYTRPHHQSLYAVGSPSRQTHLSTARLVLTRILDECAAHLGRTNTSPDCVGERHMLIAERRTTL